MKRVFIQTPFPLRNNCEDLKDLEEIINEDLGITIKFECYEWEEDDQTGYFDVEEKDMRKVVEYIYDYGDISCYDGAPRAEIDEDGNYIAMQNEIEL